jgi:AcrR family transcriptional regulator
VADPTIRQLRALRVRCEAELRKLVVRAARGGANTGQIADSLGISRATLYRRYGEDLRRSRNRQG